MREKACRNCHRIVTNQSICPYCKTHTLSDDFAGLIIIIDSQKSEIAKKLQITQPGRYAFRVR